MSEVKVQVNMELPEDLYEWLRSTAFAQRTSMRAIALEALVRERRRLEKAAKGA